MIPLCQNLCQNLLRHCSQCCCQVSSIVHPRLRDSLRSAGQICTHEAVFAQMKSIQFATDETAVKTADMIQKLITMHEKAARAGSDVMGMMQSSQIIGKERTWIGKWSVVTRVCLASTNASFSVIIRVTTHLQSSGALPSKVYGSSDL